MAGQTVVVLGGGTGGLVAASRLRRMLDKENRVVLVSRSPYYTFEPALPRVMLGEREPAAITRDLKALTKRGIEFRAAEVIGVDFDRKAVNLHAGELPYEQLVIALGADYSAKEVPGLNRAWSFYHAEGAEGLREELPKFASGRVAVAAPALPYKCPAALYEGAFLLDRYFRGRGLRDGIDIHVYTPEARPLEASGKQVGERMLSLLKSRGIGFTGGAQMKSVNHEKGVINFAGGSIAAFDMLVATPVHRPPYPLQGSAIMGEDGWVAVDRETLATSAPDVYAVGDCVSIPIGGGRLLPKSGVFAHGQAEVVARNLTAKIGGGPPIWAYGGQGACFMRAGDGRAAYIVGNYYQDAPTVHFHGPNRFRGWQMSGFERIWLWRWF